MAIRANPSRDKGLPLWPDRNAGCFSLQEVATRLSQPRSGIVLLTAVGLLTALSFLAVLFLQDALVGARTGAGRSDRARAALDAESALLYAAARLWEDPMPLDPDSRTAANAPDDCAWRGFSRADAALPPERVKSPSWRRGDPWTDADGDGVCDEGEPFEDADGDGRATSWTGRLRGGTGRFTILARPAESCVNVNGGELGSPAGDHDLDGVLNGEDPDYGEDLFGNYPTAFPDLFFDCTNGIPDWRDPHVTANRHLVNTLDNLGAVLGLALETPAPPYAPGPRGTGRLGTLEITDLGRRIVAARPRGGYASVEALRAVLGADFDVVTPFLTAAGERVPVVPMVWGGPIVNNQFEEIMTDGYRVMLHASSRFWFEGLDPAGPHARIDLNTAPVEVIESTLRYLTASGAFHQPTEQDLPLGPFTTDAPFVRLLPDEARRIAEDLAAARPIRTWPALADILGGLPQAAFEDDPFTSGNDSQGQQRRFKEDLILAHANANPWWPDPYSWTLATLDRPARGPRKIWKNSVLPPWINTAPYDRQGQVNASLGTGVATHPAYQIPNRATAEWSLATLPSAFEIDAAAWSALSGSALRAQRRATLHLGESFPLTGQRDFERVLGVTGHPAAWRAEGGALSCSGPAGAQGTRAEVQSFPRFPITAYPPLSSYDWGETDYLYPPWGDLRLSVRQMGEEDLGVDTGNGTNGCVLALPFNEDRAASGWTLYAANEWRDNLGDPVRRAPGGPTRAPPWFVPWGECQRGVRLSPWGPRAPDGKLAHDQNAIEDSQAPARYAGSFSWNDGPGSQDPFPMERRDFNNVPKGGEIIGTVSFLYLSRERMEGKVEALMPVSVSLDYLAGDPFGGGGTIGGGVPEGPGGPGMGGVVSYIAVKVLPDDSLEVTAVGNSGENVVSPRTPLKSGWRHVALVLSDDPGAAPGMGLIEVYIDGESTQLSLTVDMNAADLPILSTTSLKVTGTMPDDLRLFNRTMDAGEVRNLAARELARFEPQGVYTSPLFTFDPGRLPGGATIRGIAWDALLRMGTGDGVSLSVDGGPSIPWDGTGNPARVLDLPGRESFSVDAGLSTSDPSDTPVLDEIRILYGRRSPRWSD